MFFFHFLHVIHKGRFPNHPQGGAIRCIAIRSPRGGILKKPPGGASEAFEQEKEGEKLARRISYLSLFLLFANFGAFFLVFLIFLPIWDIGFALFQILLTGDFVISKSQRAMISEK